MPRTTREWARRKLDMALNNLDWVDRHLLEVVDVYLEAHPEIAAPLEQATQVSGMLKQLLLTVKGNI